MVSLVQKFWLRANNFGSCYQMSTRVKGYWSSLIFSAYMRSSALTDVKCFFYCCKKRIITFCMWEFVLDVHRLNFHQFAINKTTFQPALGTKDVIFWKCMILSQYIGEVLQNFIRQTLFCGGCAIAYNIWHCLHLERYLHKLHTRFLWREAQQNVNDVFTKKNVSFFRINCFAALLIWSKI